MKLFGPLLLENSWSTRFNKTKMTLTRSLFLHVLVLLHYRCGSWAPVLQTLPWRVTGRGLTVLPTTVEATSPTSSQGLMITWSRSGIIRCPNEMNTEKECCRIAVRRPAGALYFNTFVCLDSLAKSFRSDPAGSCNTVFGATPTVHVACNKRATRRLSSLHWVSDRMWWKGSVQRLSFKC